MTTLRHNDIWRRDFDISTSLYNDISIRKWRPANIAVAFLLAAVVLTACGGSDIIDDNNNADAPKPLATSNEEIRITSNVYRILEGTRTTTYENVSDLQEEAHLTCMAYEADSDPLVSYIPSTSVDWDSGDTRWEFNRGDNHYYWPLPATNGGAWPSLDFFGYMPATPPSYITSGPTYSADHNVTFTCEDLPMTNAGQGSSLKEFMFGMALDQNYGNAAAGVPLNFQHPFARIKLQLAASHPNITINSITFKDLKTGGVFLYNGSTSTWSSLTPVGTEDFVLTLAGDAAIFDNNPTSEKQIGDYYIMIPQDWAGEIVVNVNCLFWGEKKNYPSLTTTVPTTWQPGYSYTYTFNISPNDLIVNVSKFTEQW